MFENVSNLLCYIAIARGAKIKAKKCRNGLKVTRLSLVCSPDADGVTAEALLTFWFSSVDSREALRERVGKILRRGLKKYRGPLRISVRSSTISSKYITFLLKVVLFIFWLMGLDFSLLMIAFDVTVSEWQSSLLLKLEQNQWQTPLSL